MKQKAKSILTRENKRELLWNVTNSLLAAALVLLGNFAGGQITEQGFIYAVIAAGIVFITQMKEWVQEEKSEYCSKLFKFF